jgi:hypothetical protein
MAAAAAGGSSSSSAALQPPAAAAAAALASGAYEGCLMLVPLDPRLPKGLLPPGAVAELPEALRWVAALNTVHEMLYITSDCSGELSQHLDSSHELMLQTGLCGISLPQLLLTSPHPWILSLFKQALSGAASMLAMRMPAPAGRRLAAATSPALHALLSFKLHLLARHFVHASYCRAQACSMQ